MTKRIKIIIALLCAFYFHYGQIKEFDLENTGVQLFKGRIFVFGFQKVEKDLNLKIYKLKFDLACEDSIVYVLPKGNSGDHLKLTSDTLHNIFKIYLYKKQQKTATILRINHQFKIDGTEEEIDVARINSFALFKKEIYYYKNSVYSIQTVQDTSGTQFYLNKHKLKKDKLNFEYEQEWQFPFEKKDINSAIVIHASDERVKLFVNIIDGVKKGQWFLNINAKSGRLMKGTKISDPGGISHFMYANCLVDTTNGKSYIFGQKFSEFDIDQRNNKLSISGKNQLKLFVLCIDSAGELEGNFEFTYPVVEPKGYTNKTPVAYLLRMNGVDFKNEQFMISANILKSTAQSLCFNHINSTNLIFNLENKAITAKKTTIGTNLLFEKFYSGSDKDDMNGKICTDTLTNFEKLYSNAITLPIQIGSKTDEKGNPVYLLQKNDSKKNNFTVFALGPVKGVYQLTTLQTIPKAEDPEIRPLGNNQYLLFKQSQQDKFLLQLNNW